MSNEIWQRLAAPFEFSDLKIMPQSTSKNMDKALAVAYFDARAVQNRLDEVLTPAGWKVEYREMKVSDKCLGVMCRLSVRVDGEWIVREDGSDPSDIEGFKGAISGALKRAFSCLGNRSLYDTDLGWQPIDTYEGNDGKKRFKGWPNAALNAMEARYNRQTGIAPPPRATQPAQAPVPTARTKRTEDGEPWLMEIGLTAEGIANYRADLTIKGLEFDDTTKKARGAQVRSGPDLEKYVADLMKRREAVPA